VKGEARVGLDRGVLIPILLEAVQQPLDFRATQAADLSTWDGTIDSEPFQRLCRAISRLAGDPQTGVTAPNAHPQAFSAPRADGGRRARRNDRHRCTSAGALQAVVRRNVLRWCSGNRPESFLCERSGQRRSRASCRRTRRGGRPSPDTSPPERKRAWCQPLSAPAPAILGLGMVSAEPTALAAWIYGSAVGSILGATVAFLIERAMALLSSRGTGLTIGS
jgi:hypothetical protein